MQYRLTIAHRDFLDFSTRLRPSAQTQTLVLDSGISLRGTVSDAQGKPIERFALIFVATSTKVVKDYPLVTSDGHFEVRGLVADTYQVRLQAGNTTYMGPLELQAPMEVFVALNPPSGG